MFFLAIPYWKFRAVAARRRGYSIPRRAVWCNVGSGVRAGFVPRGPPPPRGMMHSLIWGARYPEPATQDQPQIEASFLNGFCNSAGIILNDVEFCVARKAAGGHPKVFLIVIQGEALHISQSYRMKRIKSFPPEL